MSRDSMRVTLEGALGPIWDFEDYITEQSLPVRVALWASLSVRLAFYTRGAIGLQHAAMLFRNVVWHRRKPVRRVIVR